jgi:hypothetical protein
MLGSKIRTFGPKGFATGAALAADPPPLALKRSATRTNARERSLDRTPNMGNLLALRP